LAGRFLAESQKGLRSCARQNIYHRIEQVDACHRLDWRIRKADSFVPLFLAALPEITSVSFPRNTTTHEDRVIEALNRKMGAVLGVDYPSLDPGRILQSIRDTYRDISQWNLRSMVEQFLDMKACWNTDFCFEPHPNPDMRRRRGSWERSIVVTSHPVELEGTELGRFILYLSSHTDQRHIRLWANPLEPNYAYRSDDVSHPHVRGDAICLGGSAQSVSDALRALDIYGGFKMALMILYSYNPDGAHIRLSEWEEEVRICYNCDDREDESDDEFTACSFCQPVYPASDNDNRVYCEECISRCEGDCNSYVCPSHGIRCSACGYSFCENCFDTKLIGSGHNICGQCLKEREVTYEQRKTEAKEQTVFAFPEIISSQQRRHQEGLLRGLVDYRPQAIPGRPYGIPID